MVGVKERRVVDENTCSSDLCLKSARVLLEDLNWKPESIDALIFVTQTPDYFLPSTSCLIHRDLKLSESCATSMWALVAPVIPMDSGLHR